MTANMMARRHTAAGPNPEEHTRVIDNRNFERLLNGIRNGTVRLDTADYRYRNTRNNTVLDDTVFAAEDHGWVTLTPGGQPEVTAAGAQWLADRYATFGPSTTRPLFLAADPDAAAKATRAGAYRGERIHTARLNEAQVRDIRARLNAGHPGVGLAQEYGVAEETISSIKKGRTWRHVA